MFHDLRIYHFSQSHTVKSQKIFKPIWDVKSDNNKPKNTIKKIKFILKWLKFFVYSFVFIVTLWGCFQTFSQPYTVNVASLGQGLEFGYAAGTTGDFRFDLESAGTGTYWTFVDYTLAFGPFISWFVYPLAKISLDMLYAFTPALSYGGFATLFLIIIVLIIMRSLIFWPSLKATLLSEKSLEHQGAINEINAKYANIEKTDKNSKMQKQKELQEYNRKHGINPFGQLETIFSTLPVFLIILKLFGILRPIKATILFGIWDLSVIPFNSIFQNFGNGGWVYIFLMIFVIPVQFISNRLPQHLAKKRNRNSRAVSQKGQEQMKKQMKIQNIMSIMFVVFPLFISSSTGVYYFFSSLFTIAQTMLIHHIIEKRRKSGYSIDRYLNRFGIETKSQETTSFFQNIFNKK